MGFHMLTLPVRVAARAAVLAFACALALAAAGPRVALAQGTSGAFVDPLSIGELKQLIEQRADVPADAWPRIQSAHDAYARRAAEFRNGDIERFQVKWRATMNMSVDPESQLAHWQSTMREFADLARRLDAIDDALFDDVATALESVPDAAAAVESAKFARRRQAMRSGFGRAMMSPSTSADLEQVAFDVPVPDAARAAVRQALSGYGRKQTPALREYCDRMQQMYQEVMKAQIAAQRSAAASPPAEGDAESQAMEAGEAAQQEIWARMGPEISRQRKQLLANNRATSRAVHDALAAHPEWQQRFADRWIVESYPGIPDSESTGVPQAGRRALRLKALDDAARATVSQAVADWRKADNALVAEWSVATDDFEGATSPFGFDENGFRAFNERVGDFQRRRTERSTQALKAIEAVSGAEMASIVRGEDLSRDDELLAPERAEAGGGDAPPTAATAADEKVNVATELLRMQRRAVAKWSAALGPDDVARVAAALGVDAGQRSVIESLASDHSDGWTERINPIFAESAARLTQGAASGDATPLLQGIRTSIEAARTHRDALDAAFFDGLGAVAAGADAARVVAALRQLRQLDSGIRDDLALMFMMDGGAPTRARVDPLEGVWQAIAADRRAELLALLEANLAASQPLLEALRAAGREIPAAEAKMQQMTPDTPEAEREAFYRDSSLLLAGHAKSRAALRAADEALAAAALALLTDDARARVRLVRVRAQHPHHFRDDPVKGAFDRALALEGVDEATRTAITGALTEYLTSRDASDGALVAAVADQVDYPVYGEDLADSAEAQQKFAKQYEAWMLGNEKVERALYVRRGGRERALVALSGILGPERTKAARVPDAASLAREEARRREGADAEDDE
jgi:hypothetical protein